MITLLPEKLTKEVSLIGMYLLDKPSKRAMVPAQAITGSLKVSTMSVSGATSIASKDGEVLSRRGGVISIGISSTLGALANSATKPQVTDHAKSATRQLQSGICDNRESRDGHRVNLGYRQTGRAAMRGFLCAL